MGTLHFLVCATWCIFRVLAYSSWSIDTALSEWREENPRQVKSLENPIWLTMYRLRFFVADLELWYLAFLTAVAYKGITENPLYFSIHLIDLCRRSAGLAKVLSAIFVTADQLVATVVFGFCIQYMCVCVSFMLFHTSYSFPDNDTSTCDSMRACLIAHLDYGFRGGPVWSDISQGKKLTISRMVYDYIYYMLVILILAAIISGIIIDTFADMRTRQASIDEDMTTLCFICSFNRSQIERAGVKFHHHIYQEHYMWAYARFLLHLEEADKETLTGAES